MSVHKLGRGIDLIAAERLRQIAKHGYGAAHDDEHGDGELAEAACAYLMPAEFGGQSVTWPFEQESYKCSASRVEKLAKAGALIAAEIDRLLRAGHADPASPEAGDTDDIDRDEWSVRETAEDEQYRIDFRYEGDEAWSVGPKYLNTTRAKEVFARLNSAREGGPKKASYRIVRIHTTTVFSTASDAVHRKITESLKLQQQDPNSGDGY